MERLDAGAPHRNEPIFTIAPGRDVPELRIDGQPVGPVRWPETSLSPVPLVAVESACLRRYAPICGPLSSTGGPRIDLTLCQSEPARANSVIRLTQGSYETFTQEICLRRPIGPTFVVAFYGDSKSDGRDLWHPQKGQTAGARVSHRLGGGWFHWGFTDAFDRSRLLTTKRTLWDHTDATASWSRADSAGISIRTSLQWDATRGAWETSRGRTERKGRSVRWSGYGEQRTPVGRIAAVVESEFARVHLRRPGEEQDLQKDAAIGAAIGFERATTLARQRFSCGVVRLAPLQAAPVFAAEAEIDRAGVPRLLVYASRAVRNRSLPRLPSDGEAWVRQGIGLAAERDGEPPEALWRLGIEAGPKDAVIGWPVFGLDLLHATRSLTWEMDDLTTLGTDGQDQLAEELQRSGATFLSPWVRCQAHLPFGFRLHGSMHATAAQGGVAHHLGVAAIRGWGEVGWSRLLFRGDLLLDLALQAEGRSRAAGPYGSIPAIGILDGEARGRIGAADIFFVMANLMNVEANSFSYDGGFQSLPLRHYRAGLRWTFVN